MMELSIYKDLFAYIFRRTLKNFKEHPVSSALQIIAALAISFAPIVILNYADKRNQEALEKKRSENVSYNQQIDALNNVQSSLNNLVQFVESQKKKLKESEDLVNSLKSEQERLKPVVEANRKTVEALLDLQYQRTRNDIWKDRSVGFALGFISSIFASFVYGLARYLLKRKSKAKGHGTSATA